MFPNPVGDELNIYFFGDKLGEYDFIISDLQGKICLQNSAKKDVYKNLIELDSLARGVYTIFIRQGKNRYEAKFVKL